MKAKTALAAAAGAPRRGHADLREGLAQTLVDLSLRLGGPAATAGALRLAVQAVCDALDAGHACAHLDDLAGLAVSQDGSVVDAQTWRTWLLAHPVVATDRLQDITTTGADGPAPLVLDAAGRLYLHRYFDHEARLAERLHVALRAPVAAMPEATRAAIQALLGEASNDGARRQHEAVWQALSTRLALVSGGPGTGKTTTVLKILMAWLTAEPTARIALAAPTGKAAARLSATIRQRAGELPPELQAKLPLQASTVHRLLGVDAATGGFRHGPDRLLPLDGLVVDEASMLDLALARRLVCALPAHARIVWLGDRDQLAAVESGAVFAELSGGGQGAEQVDAGLAKARIPLRHAFRFAGDSGIGALAQAINQGDGGRVLALLDAGDALGSGGDGIERRLRASPSNQAEPDQALALQLSLGYAAYVDSVRRGLEEVRGGAQGGAQAGAVTAAAVAAAALAAFDRYRVLTALQGSSRGVRRLNVQIGAWVSGQLHGSAWADGQWYAGRPVMVLRNDAQWGLFNGDIGIAMPRVGLADPAGTNLAVWFPTPDGGVRAVAPSRLPDHDTAYVCTVHKSQGSEFDRVAVVLPEAVHPVVTREWLYTAVTRAKASVCVVGSDEVIRAACQTPTRRRSGLLARFRASPASSSG